MLGRKAKDIITGLEGIITAKAEFQFAPSRWELTPSKLNKDGCIVKSVWLDEGRIKVGKIMVTPNDVQPTIQLGQDVEDSITGKQGVATARFTFINGCIRIELTSRKLSKDEGSNDELVLDEQRLLILDTSVQPVKKTAVQTKAEVPGGPRPGPTPYSRPTR